MLRCTGGHGLLRPLSTERIVKYMANSAAKNISSDESQTIVPTLTRLGLLAGGGGGPPGGGVAPGAFFRHRGGGGPPTPPGGSHPVPARRLGQARRPPPGPGAACPPGPGPPPPAPG